MAVAYATYRASGEAAERPAEAVRAGHAGCAAQAVLRPAGRHGHRADAGPDPRPVAHRQGPRHLPRQARRPRQGRRLQDRAAARAAGRHAQRGGTPTAWSRTCSAAPRRAPTPGAAVRVGIRNATGEQGRHRDRPAWSLLNGGYTFLDAGTTATARATSQVTYSDAADKQDAVEVAKTLGLPVGAVRKGEATSNADVSVVLGQNYETTGTSGTTGRRHHGLTGTTGRPDHGRPGIRAGDRDPTGTIDSRPRSRRIGAAPGP